MPSNLLFVYGTLRIGCAHSMAARLLSEADYLGPATVGGKLYRIADYPGLMPGPEGRVTGDLFRLTDADATLAWIDAYEEVTPDFPAPREYRRERMTVETGGGAVMAWVYVYTRDPEGLPSIVGGDFLLADEAQ
ncbi:MAG: gamma-glutamylcyclotransferase family protein [Sphingobium sp.]